jgi:hypothetical protein
MKLTAARLREVLTYFPETGEFVWKVRLSKRFVVGRRAGCLLPSGYRVIGIDGSSYFAHRLAWFYVHGAWPSAQLDHKNGIKNDNRIRNLRECSPVENCRNRAGGNRRRLGFKGVSFDKRSGRWRAQIDVDSGTICLGSFESTVEAAAAYDAAARRHHGAFANTNGMFQWRRVRNARALSRRRARKRISRR